MVSIRIPFSVRGFELTSLSSGKWFDGVTKLGNRIEALQYPSDLWEKGETGRLPMWWFNERLSRFIGAM